MTKRVNQSLITSIVASLETMDIVHTLLFPEGKIFNVTVEYQFIPTDSSTNISIHDYLEHTIETIEVFPSTDATV